MPLTQEGTVVGTWPYLSPEQLGGRPADARSDVFALGAVLYEMLTARRAFPGATLAEVHAAILGESVPDPRAHAKGAARAARGGGAQVPGEGPAGALAERRRRGARAASRRRHVCRRRIQGRTPGGRSLLEAARAGTRARGRGGDRGPPASPQRPRSRAATLRGAAAARRAATTLHDGPADRRLARRAPGGVRREHRRRAGGRMAVVGRSRRVPPARGSRRRRGRLLLARRA